MTRLERLAFPLQCAMAALLSTGTSMLGVMAPLYAASLGLGPEWIGALIGLPGFFPVVLALQAGRWINAVGAPRTLFIGMSALTSAPLVLLLLPGVAALAISRLVQGFFQLFVIVSAQSLIADLANGRSHQSNFAVYATLLAVGRMIGPIMVGFIIDTAGFRASFLASFGVLVVSALTAYLVMLGALRKDRSQGVTAGAGGGGTVRTTMRNVGFQLAVLSSSGIFLALIVREAFLPVMLQELGISATTIGSLVSLGSLTAVLVRPIMPAVTKALRGTARTLVVAMSAVAIGIGLLAVADAVVWFGLLAMVTGFGTGVGIPLTIVTIASHVPPRERALALSLRLSSNHLVEIVVPVLSGVLVAAVGFAAGFAVAGLALAALTVLAMTRVRAFEALERAAQEET